MFVWLAAPGAVTRQAPGGGPTDPPEAFAIGAVVGDRLLPIARFTGSGWLQSWPEPQDAATPFPTLGQIPRDWLGIEVPHEWTVWPRGGGATSRVRVTGTARLNGGCESPVSLTTDRTASAPATEFADGVATAGDQTVDQIVPIPRDDPAYGRLRAALAAAFELPDIKGLSKTDSAKAPLNIEEAYQDAPPITPRFLVVGEKHVTQPSGVLVGIRVTAWIREPAPGLLATETISGAPIGASESVSPGIATVVPIGALTVLGQRLWLVQQVGYEGTTFILYDVGSPAILRVLAASGGGC